MSDFKIAPSVLAADFGRLEAEIRAADAGGADWIHVDVMDGHFVPNLTIGPDVCAALDRATSLPLDVHLMVEEPENYIDAFRRAGADSIAVHVEACPNLHRNLQQIRASGARAGVALNPGTPAAAIEQVIGDVDQILVMTVNPGFGGQKFIDTTLPKIRQIRDMIAASGRAIDLVVDGGVGLDNVAEVAGYGANAFVMGSAFFKSGDYKRFVEEIRARLAPLA